MGTQGETVVFSLHGMPPLTPKAEWSSPCLPPESQQAPQQGPAPESAVPGPREAWRTSGCSLCLPVFGCIDIWPGLAKEPAQWHVAWHRQSLLSESFSLEMVSFLISVPLILPFIFWSNLINTDALLLSNSLLFKKYFFLNFILGPESQQ